MEIIELTIVGEPMPKQSVKQGKDHYGNKVFYTDSKIKQREKEILEQVNNVVGDNHQLWQGKPIIATITYVYQFPKTMSKKMMNLAQQGKIIYKTTKPDVGDNLNKLILDVLEGVIYRNDSEIVELKTSKVYGNESRTEISLIFNPYGVTFYPKTKKY